SLTPETSWSQTPSWKRRRLDTTASVKRVCASATILMTWVAHYLSAANHCGKKSSCGGISSAATTMKSCATATLGKLAKVKTSTGNSASSMATSATVASAKMAWAATQMA